jgi:UDPglucose 6-dehydrogenase
MPKVAVAGAGYVGITTAVCLAELGNEVVGVDIDPKRVRELQRHRLPIYEPGLEEMLERNATAGRLSFTTCYKDAIPGAEFVFIAVATPEGTDGSADLGAVEAAARSIAETMTGYLVIVNKSTVPIGTGDLVSGVVAKHSKLPFDVVSNPEFLREGSAVKDFMTPDRVVIGAAKEDVAKLVAQLYDPLQATVLITDLSSAEMIKYASNAFLATRISFINEIARISERVGADVDVVARGMGLDQRIGPHFLQAGLGYGGSCFPKDVKALAAIAHQYDYHPELLHAVMDINRDQRTLVVDWLRKKLDGLQGRVVGLLGLAFKPNTDDLRDAPSLVLAAALQAEGARVQAYDPAAMKRARQLASGISYRRDAYGAARGADAVVLVTEWDEFRQLDLDRLRKGMRRPTFVDGRNLYDPAVMRGHGFEYRGIGRD